VSDGQTGVRTFLIADVRGYSRFTEEYGDEAAARLAAKFADVVAEEIDAHGGGVVEIRGDEALAVFTSARQAIRAGVALQRQFELETAADSDLPLHVGIGIDAGEAVALEDGSFRGAALNVAPASAGERTGARCCSVRARRDWPVAWQGSNMSIAEEFVSRTSLTQSTSSRCTPNSTLIPQIVGC
jgi:hypothetical protein